MIPNFWVVGKVKFMQTQSHFLLTALAGQQFHQHNLPIRYKAWLIGSVLPDIPLALLTLGSTLYYRWFPVTFASADLHEELHFRRFFTDPLWIASHNFFHSFVIGALLLALGWWAWRRQRNWGLTLIWLVLATQLHTLIDIFTHSSDGPVFLFPLTWSYRFASPISYWEPAYYGRQFRLFEMVLDGLILIYFGISFLHQRRKRSASAQESAHQG